MEIGWIDFSKTDRDKVVGILDLLSEQGVLDELGIAQIRDGFSNLFFPGTTTVQTRAKYFLMIPYIFKSLESNTTNDPDKLKNELSKLEINCAETILQKNPEENGVIGKRSFDQEKQRINRNKWVKRPPSSIYWAGLKTYRIFQYDISIDEYIQKICSRKISKETIFKSGNSGDGDGYGHDDKGAGDIQSFHFWNNDIKYEKDWLNELKMDLTNDEGAFLKEQIINSCPDSMLKFILENDSRGILNCESFFDLGNAYEFPNELKIYYNLAKDFSEFNYVLRILFNIIASNGESERANRLFDERKTRLIDIASFNLNLIFNLFDINDSNLIDFLTDAQKFMKANKIKELKVLIKDREIFLKGENRSRTCHPEEYDKWLAGCELDYRFHIAKTIIEDIFKSEEDTDDEKIFEEES